MNGSASIELAAGPDVGAPSWRVRIAAPHDLPTVSAAIDALLRELGAMPPPAPAMEAAARVLLDDPDAGTLLVAHSVGGAVGAHPDAQPADSDAGETTARGGGDAIVGVLGASWQSAIHIPGRYALIQDLWVSRAWRGRGVGAGLLTALFKLAGEQGVARVEVGLPRESFAELAATEAFYLANGFTALGPRMRRRLT